MMRWLAALLLATVSIAAQPRGTADWFKLHRPVHTEVTVNVAYLQVHNRQTADGESVFTAWTAHGASYHGAMTLITTRDQAARLAARYGTEEQLYRGANGRTEIRTQTLRAFLRDRGGSLILVVGSAVAGTEQSAAHDSGESSAVLFRVGRVHQPDAAPHETQPELLRLFALLNQQLQAAGQTQLTQNELLTFLRAGRSYPVKDGAKIITLRW